MGYIDTLDAVASKHGGKIVAAQAAEPLLWIIHEMLLESLDDPNAENGIIVSTPTPDLAGSLVVGVNRRYLQLLGYEDRASVQTAVDAPGFVHAEDVQHVSENVGTFSAASYPIRLKRANGSYLDVVARGITFQLGPELTVYRISVIRRRDG